MTGAPHISLEELKAIISAYTEQSSERIAEHIVDQILMLGTCMNAIDDDVNGGCEVMIRFTIPPTKKCEWKVIKEGKNVSFTTNLRERSVTD